MQVARVVVGHTVVVSGQVAELCGGALLMVDVALSRSMSSRKLGNVLGLECRASSDMGGQQEGAHGPEAGVVGEGSSSSGLVHGPEDWVVGEGAGSSGLAVSDGGGEAAGGQCTWVQKGGGDPQASGLFFNKDECEGRARAGGQGELRVWKADGLGGKSVARLLRRPPP